METQMCTELITNNAAAALATPIAFTIARELEVRESLYGLSFQVFFFFFLFFHVTPLRCSISMLGAV